MIKSPEKLSPCEGLPYLPKRHNVRKVSSPGVTQGRVVSGTRDNVRKVRKASSPGVTRGRAVSGFRDNVRKVSSPGVTRGRVVSGTRDHINGGLSHPFISFKTNTLI